MITIYFFYNKKKEIYDISKTVTMNVCRKKKKEREILNRLMERGEKVYAGNEFFCRASRYFYANPGSVECPGRYTTDLIRVAGTNLRFALPFARA